MDNQVSRHAATAPGGSGQGGGPRVSAMHRGPAQAVLRHGLRLRGHALHQLRASDHPTQHHGGHRHHGLLRAQGQGGVCQPVVSKPRPEHLDGTGRLRTAAFPASGRIAQQGPGVQRDHLLPGQAALHRRGPVQDAAVPLYVAVGAPVPHQLGPGQPSSDGLPLRADAEAAALLHSGGAQRQHEHAGQVLQPLSGEAQWEPWPQAHPPRTQQNTESPTRS